MKYVAYTTRTGYFSINLEFGRGHVSFYSQITTEPSQYVYYPSLDYRTFTLDKNIIYSNSALETVYRAQFSKLLTFGENSSA